MVFNYLKKFISFILQFLIMSLRPLLGPPAHCVYALSCTKFALYQLEHEPLGKAVWVIIKRLLSCNPITSLLIRNSKPRKTVSSLLLLLFFLPPIIASEPPSLQLLCLEKINTTLLPNFLPTTSIERLGTELLHYYQQLERQVRINKQPDLFCYSYNAQLKKIIITDKKKINALEKRAYVNSIIVLQKLGWNINTTDLYGITLLHYMVACQFKKPIKVLLECSADPYLNDPEKDILSSFEVAKKGSNKQIITLFK